MNPKPLTFAQVASRADRKAKAFEKRIVELEENGCGVKSSRVKRLEEEHAYWRGVAACARYFKTGENNLGV
jgi:hypothetical protein